jgi:hypothetical protein
MDPRSLADGVVSFLRPQPDWRRQASAWWLAVCAAAAVLLLALAAGYGAASSALTMVNANLAYGFARVDPLVLSQEIRGRYAYCGYDWDRRCQLRDPLQTQEPPVDRWLEAHPASSTLVTPPSQSDVTYVETDGASSLIDDPRFADAEYVLGAQDVAVHVLGQMAAGGAATLGAIVLCLGFGFAAFGGQKMRAINPLWYAFVLVTASVFAWAALHVLADPAGFELALAVEIAALAALPVFVLVRLRKAIVRRETAFAYRSVFGPRARAKNVPSASP